MAEDKLPVTTCTSENHGGEPCEPRSNGNPSSAAELELGDSREPLSPPENGITPVLMTPTEEEHGTGGGTGVQVAASMICTVPATNIGVRVLLKEIEFLAQRAAFLQTEMEPLKRYDGATADDSAEIMPQSSSTQPGVNNQRLGGDVDITHELKQSIKESAELIRTINGDFSRLGEKLNEWIPVVDQKGELSKSIYNTLVTEQEKRVKELKEQLNSKNTEMELVYEKHKETISELSEELSRKKELEILKNRVEKLQAEAQEKEKKHAMLYHENKGIKSEIERLTTSLQKKEEKIKQLEADVNNKIESAKTEIVQGFEKERDRLSSDNQQQKEKIAQLEKNLESVRLELIEQLKTDKQQSKMQSDLMLNVIQKKILDSSVQEQLIQTVLKINKEPVSAPSKDDSMETNVDPEHSMETNVDPEHTVPDKPIDDDKLHKNNLNHKTKTS